MFGLSFAELLLIMVVILVVVGPDKLPEVARTVGRTMWQLKHLLEELRKEAAIPSIDDLKRELLAPPRPPPVSQPIGQVSAAAVAPGVPADQSPGTATTIDDQIPIFEPQLEGTCEEYKLRQQKDQQQEAALKQSEKNDDVADC